jgi:hypothetical protein
MYIVLPIVFWLYVLKISTEWVCESTNYTSSYILLAAVSFFAFLDVLYCAGILSDTALQTDPKWENIKNTLIAELCIGVVGILLALLNMYTTFNASMRAKKCGHYSIIKGRAR